MFRKQFEGGQKFLGCLTKEFLWPVQVAKIKTVYFLLKMLCW